MMLVESFKSFLASSLDSTVLMNSFNKASLVMTPSGLAVNFFGSGAAEKKNRRWKCFEPQILKNVAKDKTFVAQQSEENYPQGAT